MGQPERRPIFCACQFSHARFHRITCSCAASSRTSDGRIPRRLASCDRYQGPVVRRSILRRDHLDADLLSPGLSIAAGETRTPAVLSFVRRRRGSGVSAVSAMPPGTGTWRDAARCIAAACAQGCRADLCRRTQRPYGQGVRARSRDERASRASRPRAGDRRITFPARSRSTSHDIREVAQRDPPADHRGGLRQRVPEPASLQLGFS